MPAPRGEVAAWLDHDALLAVLDHARADAVWPGWGFVAEDAAFVERVTAAGLCFLGPSAATMRALGDKIAAKLLAERPASRSRRGAARRCRPGARRISPSVWASRSW